MKNIGKDITIDFKVIIKECYKQEYIFNSDETYKFMWIHKLLSKLLHSWRRDEQPGIY